MNYTRGKLFSKSFPLDPLSENFKKGHKKAYANFSNALTILFPAMYNIHNITDLPYGNRNA